MNTCYVFLINGHLIYCDTKGSTWHSICSNSLPTPTTLTPSKKLLWYLNKFRLRSLQLNWPLHQNTMSQACLFAGETSLGNLNWSRSNVGVRPHIFRKQITNITREIFSKVMHLQQARGSCDTFRKSNT